MSKKTKKRHALTLVPNVPAQSKPTAQQAAEEGTRFTDLEATARGFIASGDWASLLELGRTPLTTVRETDRPAAKVLILRARVRGLFPDFAGPVHMVVGDQHTELASALELLAECFDTFYAEPEFDLYINTRRWTLTDSIAVFEQLSRACMVAPNLKWIRSLRVRAMRLLTLEDYRDEPLTEGEHTALSALPNVSAVLNDVYAVALDSLEGEEASLLLAALRVELEMVVAEPWDHDRVIASLARLPSPAAETLPPSNRLNSRTGPRDLLTPKGWAFFWELEHVGPEDLPDLLVRYRGGFGCDVCDGLYLVAATVERAPERDDETLSRAVALLMAHFDGAPDIFGESLTFGTSGGALEVFVGAVGLRRPSVSGLLLRLAEIAPATNPRGRELVSLSRICAAAENYDPLDADEPNGDENMPGLAWLCEQSISFQFAAAAAIQGVGGRMRLVLDALCRCLEQNVRIPHRAFLGDSTSGDLEASGALAILTELERLVPLRPSMDERTVYFWLSVIPWIFKGLSDLNGNIRSSALSLAREFSRDLIAAGETFRLAYLEQVAGDAEAALIYYLATLNASGKADSSVVKNCKLLWQGPKALANVQSLVDVLKEESLTSKRPEVVRDLLADAQACLVTLNRGAQFEQTAVNRWPSLSAPARKLLGVFATIQRYNGFKELGGYAGMAEDWAERHYNKLVETGMLLVSEKGFRVNPYIEPLLERESQHAVVGRIIRGQGTSAVKQVFNSQREFTIYQLMVQLCPNHLVFPNSSLQSFMSYERMKELVNDDDFGYYLRCSVDVLVVSSTTYLPMLAIEVDSVWHDTERQQKNDGKKDRLFAAAGVPFMRLRPVGSPSESAVRAQVAEHLDTMVRTLRSDLPGFEQTKSLLEDLSGTK